jgi:membrane protease YdiL (CAAX protease family)
MKMDATRFSQSKSQEAPRTEARRTSSKRFLVVLSVLLIVLVGPLFGPVPALLLNSMDVPAATAWEVVLFLVPFSIILVVMLGWMRRNGRTLADLGWRQPTTLPAIILGTLLGVFWAAFGAFGYLQFNPDANLMELSLFRVFTAVVGAGAAILEDLITRGFVMGELKRLKTPTWLQILASSLLFALYHSLWWLNPVGFVFSVVYGLLLGGLFVLGKRSLTPVILAHSLALLLAEPFLTLSLMEAIKLGLG